MTRYSHNFTFYIIFIILSVLLSCKTKDQQIVLDGIWQWQHGFNNSWLTEDPGGWHMQNYPLRFRLNKEFKNHQGYITLRKEIPGKINSILKVSNAITFFSNYASDVAVFYINEYKIGGLGSVSPYVSGNYLQFVGDINKSYFKKKNNYLTIVLYSNGIYPLSLEGGNIRIGKSESVHNHLSFLGFLDLFFLTFYLAVGLYHLLLAIRRFKEIYNLYFALFCILVSFYWVFGSHYRDIFFPNPDTRMIFEYIVLFYCGPAIIAFFSTFFDKRLGIIPKIYFIYIFILTPFAFFGSYTIKIKSLFFFQVSVFPAILYVIYLIIKHIKRKNRDAYYLLFGSMVLMVSLLNDVLDVMAVIDTAPISKFGFFIFIAGIAGSLANKFVRVQTQVESLNEELEVKVQERTLKLANSLKDIKLLKTQQDGDYFLTSLLIQPLSGLYSKSKTVKVQMFLRQKMQFLYKNIHAEIGGDLITTYNLILQQRNYVAILNGDAMGKSIQGAGGALVLGTVFKSVVTRTPLSSATRDKSPERWIKDCFIDLQLIFETFEGSMLVSSIISLIDCESGLMYYINAEHPWIVLYRDGNARFIEEDYPIRKIGLAGYIPEKHLQIEVFQFENEDVIFFGSDGRDDILIKNANQVDIINDDENEFIRCINDTQADLEKLPQAITKHGYWTDDCSIVKIQFLNEQIKNNQMSEVQGLANEISSVKTNHEKSNLLIKIQDKLKIYNDNFLLMKYCADLFFELEKYKDAVKFYEKSFTLNQKDPSLLENLSIAYGKIRNTGLAIEYGERLRLRNRRNSGNLKHLADIYKLIGNKKRSEYLTMEAKQVKNL